MSDDAMPGETPAPALGRDLTPERDSLLARIAAAGVTIPPSRTPPAEPSASAEAVEARPASRVYPVEWLHRPYVIELANGKRHETTIIRRLAELILRNQGQEGKAWQGTTLDLDCPCGFRGLTPQESMELQNLLGVLNGISIAHGDDESLAEAAVELLRIECEILTPIMRKAAEGFAARPNLWTPGNGAGGHGGRRG